MKDTSYNINKFNSVIHTTARDEDLIINEWIVHHILLGFEHIYIYDDNSIIPISETIKILPNWIQEKLTIYRLSFDKFEEEAIKNTEYMEYYKSEILDNKQLFIVKYFIYKHKHLSNWCLFCDVDEFIYLRDHVNINNFLKNYENETNLLIPWLLYGTSFIINNIYSDYLVMDYNNYHNDSYNPKISWHVKSFANLNKPINPKSYHWVTNKNYLFDRNTSPYELPIHINHYQKIDVKTFLRRKLKQDFGRNNCNKRCAENLFKMLLEDNVSNNKFDKMEKYIHNIAKILNKKILNYDLDLNKDLNLCPSILYSKCRFISIDTKITYDLLRDLLNDENLRYAHWNELLPEDFDLNIYKELYPHLQNLNDMEVKTYYYNVGIKKNLSYKLDFDAKLHYINYGINEGRLYKYDISELPKDFESSIYINLNPDLINMSDFDAKLHYINHGINEKRLYIKYNIVIQTIAKDEDHIINEWIVHHILLGFEHIYIYDDNSIIPISETIKILPQWIINKITIYRLDFDFYNPDEIKKTVYKDFYNNINDQYYITNKQHFFLKYFINNHRYIKWCLFNDLDEFIYLKEDKKIMDFIIKYNEYDILIIPWLCYGTSGYIDLPKGLIIDNFRYHDNHYHSHSKCIVNLNKIDINNIGNIHEIYLKNQFKFKQETKLYELPIHINHYVKLNVKTFLRRKCRNEVGFRFGVRHDAINILNAIYRDTTSNNKHIMNKYISDINNILKFELSENFNDLNLICTKFLYLNTLITSDSSLITYDFLKSLITDENLRYPLWNELLPIDFDLKIYKELYPHLSKLDDIEIKTHYINHGKIKNLHYKLDTSKLPIDFDVKIYKELNPDLLKLNDTKATQHYINNGINEKRDYNYDITKLPIDFDIHMYREFNFDIRHYNNSQLISHYINHGIIENRKYKDIHFDEEYFINKYNIDSNLYLKYISDIRQSKNSYFTDFVNKYSVNSNYKYIFLVNHDYCLFGANHYMYLLFDILNKKYQNTNIKPLLCEISYNPQLLTKYSISQNDVIEYKNDPTLLYMLFEHFNPKLVYLNSCNFAIFNVYKYIPKDITILHSHEIFDHYLLAKFNIPSFVVSQRIAQEYNTYYKNDNNFVIPLVQSPFLNNIDEILTLSDENFDVISNDFGIIDMNKITIGMCGQITDRKNYQLFIEVSKHYSQYNFIWIGDNNNVFTQYNNIYYITHTNNPYKYYKQVIDYFILFSHQDPCPYVILENILLETPIITFEKNIYTDHKNDLTEDFYFEYPSEINLNNCIDAINKFVINKKQNLKINKSDKGKEYIDKYFSFPHHIYEKIENILNL